MFSVIFVIHLIICAAIIGLVLLQQGKGAEAGAVFGSSSDSVIGAGSAPNFIGRLTTGMAISFMVTSILLVNLYMKQSVNTESSAKDVLEGSILNTQVHEGEDTTPEVPALVPAESAEMKKEITKTDTTIAPVVSAEGTVPEVIIPEAKVEVPVAPVVEEAKQPEVTNVD